MSLLRPRSVRVNLALGALLLGLVTALTACEEDGKTAPATCADPPLAIYDIQTGGARDDQNPCTTDIGHAVSSIGTSTAGTASGGTATAGSSSGGTSGSGGTATAEAGAGGAGGAP